MARSAGEDARALERVEKLLRLAGNNANEEEARTAAVQAARLIREHGFEVRGKQQPLRLVPPAKAKRRRFDIGPWILGAIFLWWLINQVHC